MKTFRAKAPTAAHTAKVTYPGLDLIRFAAALLVVLVHYTSAIGKPADDAYYLEAPFRGHIQFPGLAEYTSLGWVGVQVFFVISGFVIAFSANGNSPWRFFRSRVLRLGPALWICATITAVALAVTGHFSGGDILVPYVRSLLFMPTSPWIDAPYWTLGVELAFYTLVFFALLGNVFSRLFQALFVAALGTTVIWTTATFLVPLYDTKVAESVLWFIHKRPAHLTMVTYGAQFALGALIWMFYQKGVTKAGLATMVLCLIAGNLEILANSAGEGQVPTLATSALPMFLWCVAVFVIIAFVHFNTAVSKVLGKLPTRSLGMMTYPLYLVHNTVGLIVIDTLVFKAGWVPGWAVALMVVASVVGSWLICMYAEPPVKRATDVVLKKLEAVLQRWPVMFRKAAAV